HVPHVDDVADGQARHVHGDGLGDGGGQALDGELPQQEADDTAVFGPPLFVGYLDGNLHLHLFVQGYFVEIRVDDLSPHGVELQVLGQRDPAASFSQVQVHQAADAALGQQP